jgi:hypothetical protein
MKRSANPDCIGQSYFPVSNRSGLFIPQYFEARAEYGAAKIYFHIP